MFKTKPLLINPSDKIGIRIFLKPVTSGSRGTEDRSEFYADEFGRINFKEHEKITVDARIAGLEKVELYDPVAKSEPLSSHWYFIPFTISLWSWSIPFLVASFLAYLWFYINAAYRLGWMNLSAGRNLAVILSSASLSLWAAEAGASILQRSFPMIRGTFGGAPLSMNLPPVAINALVISFILWKIGKLSMIATNQESAPTQ